MTEPSGLLPELVRRAHAEQLAEHGGQSGVRDEGLLDSALNRPKNAWAFASPKPDVWSLAASLAYGLARNHPFLDGNKRTAWVACRTFLRINRVDIVAQQQEIVAAVLALAAGETSEEGFAAWLREHTQA